jgi:hypothetical protein
MSGKEVSSTRANDMLARNVVDSTYVRRPYLAVGRKKRAGASRARGWRAGREGRLKSFGGQWTPVQWGSGVELTGLDA